MESPAVVPLPLDIEEAREPTSDAARQVMEAAETAKAKNAAKGVGSGLKYLMHGRSDTFDVSPFDIKIKPGWNTRDFSLPENQEHVLDLAHSIAKQGVKVPLAVYYEDGVLYLSDGECRLRGTLYAINQLNAPVLSVPVRTEPRGSNDADLVLGLLVRNSGKPLTQMEKAITVKRLLDYGWKVERIAEGWGVKVGTVHRLIDLLELPEAMRQRVQMGDVSATEAVRIVAKHGPEAASVVDRAVEAASTNGKKKRATRAAVERVTREPEPEHEETPDLTSDLEQALIEVQQLREQVESLSASDLGREITSLHATKAQLNGRVQQMLEENSRLKRTNEAMRSRLDRIRKILKVDTDRDIEGAIHDLMR